MPVQLVVSFIESVERKTFQFPEEKATFASRRLWANPPTGMAAAIAHSMRILSFECICSLFSKSFLSATIPLICHCQRGRQARNTGVAETLVLLDRIARLDVFVQRNRIEASIGARLREERARLDLTQAELGKLGGAGRKSIIRFEAGERAPDADFLRRVAKAGADVSYIVTGRHTALDEDAIKVGDWDASGVAETVNCANFLPR